MAQHLGVTDLEQLHHNYKFPLLTKSTDQAMGLHRKMYEVGQEFQRLYLRFVSEQVQELVGEDLVYQRIPNFRAQIPGNVGVGCFHRDRDNNHSRTEVNFWVPLTRATVDNTIWIESAEGCRDFRPVQMEYGQMLIFDGANLEHGNVLNRSDKTRVSFDFRIVPLSLFKNSSLRTVVKKSLLAIGDYWERLPPARALGAEQ
jgi:ectoine hydroxylase-related dioxygenase (phytanoyl-CoA dioxygenase family)